jgi:hypothetical protein
MVLGVVLLVQLSGKFNAKAAVAVNEEAVVVVLEAPQETFKMSEMSSVLWLVVTVTAPPSSALSFLVAAEDATFVIKMSMSCNNIQLVGYQPWSQMAVLLVSFLLKDFGQM